MSVTAEYYPILRGRQNELIAIRELARAGKLGHVVPIIEPVKSSNTLIKTLVESFNDKATIGIVCNPNVGSFGRDLRSDSDFKQRYIQILDAHKDAVRFYLRVSSENAESLDSILAQYNDFYSGVDRWNVVLSKGTKRDTASAVRVLQERGVVYDIVTSFPKPLNYFHARRILLSDEVKVRTRNADYRDPDDEFFSDGVSGYQMYGCEGFSDYCIVGEPFKSGGFSPRAVALHLTYFDEDDVRIKHFVSTPPDDTGDVPGKYASALEALCDWAKSQSEKSLPRTIGLRYFYQSLQDQRFPGLGAAKKFSIMHHLEMIDGYLRGLK